MSWDAVVAGGGLAGAAAAARLAMAGSCGNRHRKGLASSMTRAIRAQVQT